MVKIFVKENTTKGLEDSMSEHSAGGDYLEEEERENLRRSLENLVAQLSRGEHYLEEFPVGEANMSRCSETG